MPTPRTDSGAGEIPEVRRSTLKSVECTAKPEVFSDYWTPLSAANAPLSGGLSPVSAANAYPVSAANAP